MPCVRFTFKEKEKEQDSLNLLSRLCRAGKGGRGEVRLLAEV